MSETEVILTVPDGYEGALAATSANVRHFTEGVSRTIEAGLWHDAGHRCQVMRPCLPSDDSVTYRFTIERDRMDALKGALASIWRDVPAITWAVVNPAENLVITQDG